MNYPKNRYIGEKPWMDYGWLYNEYVVKDKGSQDIADEYGCKQSTIQSWLTKHKIKKDIVHRKIKRTAILTKDFLYNELIINKKTITDVSIETGISNDTIAKYINKYGIEYKRKIYYVFNDEQIEEVIDLYINKKMSSTEIAKIYNTDHGVVLNTLKKHGVDRRDLIKSQYTKLNKEIDERFFNKEWLYKQYYDNHLNTIEIANIFGCSSSTVARQLKRLGISLRDASESKIGVMCGEKHHNWKGGITPLHLLLRTYFHVNIAPKVTERDNYTCQFCGKKHTILHVHHIRRFTDIIEEILSENQEYKLDNPDDVQKLYQIIVDDERFLDENILITLCKECHLKVHGKNKIISIQASLNNEEGSTTISEESTL